MARNTIGTFNPRVSPGDRCIHRHKGATIAHLVTVVESLPITTANSCEVRTYPELEEGTASDLELHKSGSDSKGEIASQFVSLLAHDDSLKPSFDQRFQLIGPPFNVDVWFSGANWNVAIDGSVCASVREIDFGLAAESLEQMLLAKPELN